MFGKPIVTQEMAATAAKTAKVTNTSRVLGFGGKLLNTFNKLFYVVEGVFDFADYKKRGNSNFQAFMGSATRGVTKYLTFGAGMKGGALIGGFLGGPPGALIGAILGGIGVGMFGLDEGAADMVGGTVDKMTGADQNVEGDTSMNNNSASENIEGTNQTSNDDISVRPVSFDTSSGIVPFKLREENFDQKLALNEEVEVINLPISGNSTSQSGTSGPSTVGAGKIPKFSSSDYANNYVGTAESLFNVSTV